MLAKPQHHAPTPNVWYYPPQRKNISSNQVAMGANLEIRDHQFLVDLVVLTGMGIEVILGMK